MQKCLGSYDQLHKIALQRLSNVISLHMFYFYFTYMIVLKKACEKDFSSSLRSHLGHF